jgi:hypothetical protein
MVVNAVSGNGLMTANSQVSTGTAAKAVGSTREETRMKIIRFEMNQPREVVLKLPEGVTKQCRYGSQVIYSLADDRVMYVPPLVAGRIRELQIRPGEPFMIRKRLMTNGARRAIEWEVGRSGAETTLERELRESVEIAKASKPDCGPTVGVPAPQQTESSPTAENTLAPIANGSQNGKGQTSVPPPNANGGAVPTKLEHALKTAISAAYNAEKYGAELGYVVRFDADAIKSMAITVLINMSEGRR